MNLKFYAMALFAGMAIGASAVEPAPMKLAPEFRKAVKIDSSVLKKMESESKNMMKAPATAKDLTGDYTAMYINPLLATEQDAGAYGYDALISEDGDGYVIDYPFYFPAEDGVYDLSVQIPVKVEGNKVIFEQTTVNVAGDVFPCGAFESYIENNTQYLRPLDSFEVTFNGCGFAFNNTDIYFGVYEETEKGYAWFFLATRVSFQKPDVPDSEMNLGWKTVGTAKFQDGWVTSGVFGGYQSEEDLIWEVELQQNEEDANTYRLVNPYGEGSPYAPGGMAYEDGAANELLGMNGFIQFNVSDPDHVVFEAVPANFAFSGMGIDQIYAVNTLGMLINGYGWTAEEAIDYYGDNLVWSTFKDGVVTVPSETTNRGIVNDACFGMLGKPYAGYGWQDQQGQSTNMEAKIWFPDENSVEGIEFDENAPVKYYNLQGVEVANPANGELVIKRQGTKAQKMIVK